MTVERVQEWLLNVQQGRLAAFAPCFDGLNGEVMSAQSKADMMTIAESSGRIDARSAGAAIYVEWQALIGAFTPVERGGHAPHPMHACLCKHRLPQPDVAGNDGASPSRACTSRACAPCALRF